MRCDVASLQAIRRPPLLTPHSREWDYTYKQYMIWVRVTY